jgi:hypothetical protein
MANLEHDRSRQGHKYRIIALDEATKVLLQTRNRDTLASWLPRDHYELLIASVRKQDSTIIVEDREFEILYNDDDNLERVFLRPTFRSFVPCGWFVMENLEKELRDALTPA